MKIFKGFLISLCVLLLLFGLTGTAWSFVGLRTVHDRDTVKGWLNKSSFYDTIIDAALSNIKESNENKQDGSMQDSGGDDISTDDPNVQAIVKKVFSPTFLRTNSEKVLDGVYAWLNGETAEPTFSIDLTGAKQQLATELGAYVTTKAAGLPACTAPDQVTGDFDAFKATCLPPGLSPEAAGQQISNELLTSKEFLEKTTVTGADLKVQQNGTEVAIGSSKKAKLARDGYRLAGFMPLIAGVISVLFALAILFLSVNKRKGARRIGVTSIISGAILGITYAVLAKIPSVAEKRLDLGEASSRLGLNVLKTVGQSVRAALLWFILGYLVIGVALIIASLSDKKTPKEPKDEAHEAGPKTEVAAEPTQDKPEPANETPKPEHKPTAPPVKREVPAHRAARPADKPQPRKIQL